MKSGNRNGYVNGHQNDARYEEPSYDRRQSTNDSPTRYANVNGYRNDARYEEEPSFDRRHSTYDSPTRYGNGQQNDSRYVLADPHSMQSRVNAGLKDRYNTYKSGNHQQYGYGKGNRNDAKYQKE